MGAGRRTARAVALRRYRRQPPGVDPGLDGDRAAVSDEATWTQRRGSTRQTLLLWVLPLIFLLVFFFYPLAAIFRIAAQAAGLDGAGANIGAVVGRSLGFTVWQAL